MTRLFAFAISMALVCQLATAADREIGPRIEKLNKPVLEVPKEYGWWGSKKPIQLKDYRGKVLLFHFWTNGMESSEVNFRQYLDWKKKYAEDGLKLLGVNLPSNAIATTDEQFLALSEKEKADFRATLVKEDKAVRERAKVLELSFPMLFANNANYLRLLLGMDKDGELAFPDPKNPRVMIKCEPSVPLFFLIDRKGNLRYYVQGPLAYRDKKWDEQVEEKIKLLLKEKP